MDEKQLLEEYLSQQEAVEHIENELKTAKEHLSACKERLITYLSDRGQQRTGSYEGLGSISLKNFNTYKVNEENQDSLFEYLKQNNLDGVIKQSIHHKTFDRICNELVEEGKALPDFVNVYNITTVQLNKG